MRRKRVLESVQYRDEPLDHPRRGAPRVFGAFPLHSLAVVLEVRLAADQRLAKLLAIREHLGQLVFHGPRLHSGEWRFFSGGVGHPVSRRGRFRGLLLLVFRHAEPFLSASQSSACSKPR